MTKFLNNADIKGYIAQTAVTSYLLKADSTGRLVAAIAGTDYQAPTTALLPSGGTAGQILAKIDGTNYNAQWIDNYTPQVKHDVKLGAALSKGTPVYVSSANGTNMIVSAASNASEATSSKTLGLLETGGALNDTVKVITEGLLAGLNTSTATAGDPVWLGPNGTLLFGLANKPSAPVHMVSIGIVTRVQSVNGEIFVKVQNGFELDELHNVALASSANNEGLFYDSATSLWKNKTIAAVLGYTPANDSAVVHLAGTETITGVKTFSSVINASTLSLNGGTLAGNNIVSMRSNPTGGQFRIEKSDGSLSAYPFYIGVDGTALAYYYNAAGALKVLLHTDGTSYFGNSLSVGYSTYAATSYSLDVNGSAQITSTLQVGGNLYGTGATFSGTVIVASPFTIKDTNPYIQWKNASDTRLGYIQHATNLVMAADSGNIVFNTTLASATVSAAGLTTLQFNDTSGNRTSGINVLAIQAENSNAPYNGFGGAIVFNNRAYTSGIVASTRIRSQINNNSIDSSGGSLIFEVTPTVGGTLTAALSINYNSQLRLNAYTTSSSFSGTAAGYLAFDSSGNVITVAGVAATDNTKLPLAGGTTTGIVTFGGSNNSTDNVRFQNTDGNYAYIRQTAASNSNNVWYDGTLGATMWYAWDNPGSARTANVYTQHTFGTGRGTSNEAVTINRGAISGTNSSGTTTYSISRDGSASLAGGITFTAPGGSILLKHAVSEVDAWIFQENATNWGLYWKNAPTGQHTFGGYTSVGAELVGMSAANASGNGILTSNFVGATSAYAQWMMSNYTGYIWSASTIYAVGDMRTPVFRFTNSTNNAYLTGNSDWGFRVVNDSGYIQFGPANPSWAHIYSGLPFYFNQELYINGTQVVKNSGTWAINISGNAASATNSTNATYANNASGGFTNTGAHGSSFIHNELLASNNGAATGRVVLKMWCSEPGVTWDWAGFGYNVTNDGGSPSGFGRFNTSFGQAYMRFSTSGDWYFYNTTTGGTRTTSMSFSSSGNASFGGKISNGSVWINNGVDYNSYNENIRLFAAPNGVSVIAFNASGTSGTPAGGSILGFDDRLEFRKGGDAWQLRIFSGNVEANGSFRAPIFYDSNDTNYYLDANNESNLYRFTSGTMTRNAINYLSINSPWQTRSAQARNYQNGTMGWGNTDFNTVFSNWGSGFIDTWSSPANAPGGSTHYVGLQGMHYNHENSTNGYGFQMACAGEADNRFFWRSSWATPRSWVEMIHSGNIGSQSVNYASSAGSVSWGNVSSKPGNIVYYDQWMGSLYLGSNGNLYMSWAGVWLDTWLNQSVKTNAGPTFQTVYLNDWCRVRYESGVYFESYDAGLRSAYQASFGQVATYGTARSGHGGYIIVNNYITNLMQDTSGNFGFFSNNDWAWRLFYNRGNNCWGIGTDNTYSGDGFRCIKYGSAEYGWTTWSDRRAKENISTINGALDKVLGMRGVYYNYIKDETKSQHVGFIAQELMEILPQSVRYAEEIDEYNINYGPIVSVLSEAIKEQNIEIQSLKAQLQTLLN